MRQRFRKYKNIKTKDDVMAAQWNKPGDLGIRYGPSTGPSHETVCKHCDKPFEKHGAYLAVRENVGEVIVYVCPGSMIVKVKLRKPDGTVTGTVREVMPVMNFEQQYKVIEYDW